MNFYGKTEGILGALIEMHINPDAVVSLDSIEILQNLWRVRLVSEFHRVTISGHKFTDDTLWRVQISPPDIASNSDWLRLAAAGHMLTVVSVFKRDLRQSGIVV